MWEYTSNFDITLGARLKSKGIAPVFERHSGSEHV
jgi:hypothetical protein